MKTIQKIGVIAIAAMVMVGCGSSKKAAESRIEKGKSLDGEKVVVETAKLSTHSARASNRAS